MKIYFDKKKHTSVHRHKKLPIRNIERVATYLKLADMCRLIEGMRKHCHKKYAPEEQTAMLHQLAEMEIYGYQKTRAKPLHKTA